MKVSEIFKSIQGEGKKTGLPTIFIRLSGCNLRCTYCDTKYAYHNGKELKKSDIIKKIERYNIKNICITGGEPLLQEKEIIPLIKNLIKKKYEILIETNGSFYIKKLSEINSIVISMDIKCPSSKMHEKTKIENTNFLKTKDQIKFVIKDKKDYDYAKKIIQKNNINCPIFFQPVWGTDPKKLAQWIIKDNLKVQLGLQLHKIIWNEKRGK